jgi:hypothetical protein
LFTDEDAETEVQSISNGINSSQQITIFCVKKIYSWKAAESKKQNTNCIQQHNHFASTITMTQTH